MKESDLAPNSPGELVPVLTPRGDRGLAFVPDHLPVSLELTQDLMQLVEESAIALGNLNGVSARMRNPLVFSQPFLRQEAVASTRIEGSQTNLEQLVLFELEQEHDQSSERDERESLNYVRALSAGWENVEIATQARSGLLQLHQMLLESVRGAEKHPGEYRNVPAYLGGASIFSARFVPPPPDRIPELMDNLFSYVVNPQGIPKLIQLAIIHYQFETIHPFGDGNGRTGRLMIPLYLKRWGLLEHPILYLSSYFEANRRDYIEGLFRVSTENAWGEWIGFFLEAVRAHCIEAATKAHQLLDLEAQLIARFESDRSPHVLPIIALALESMAVSLPEIEAATGARRSTVYGIMRRLVADGVFRKASMHGGRSAYFLVPLMELLVSDTASS